MSVSPSFATRTVLLLSTSVPPSGSADLSQYVTSSEFNRTADTEDITTYGKTSKVYAGTLKDATFTCEGVYSIGSSGTPRVLLEDHEGDEFEITRRPEGTGSSKPQQVFAAILNKYTETNPVSGRIRWSADFQVTDEIDTTNQSA